MTENKKNLRELGMDEIQELRRDISELSKELKSLKRCIGEFQQKYEPFLASELTRSKFWTDFRADVMRGSAKSIVFASALALGGFMLFSFKEWIKSIIR